MGLEPTTFSLGSWNGLGKARWTSTVRPRLGATSLDMRGQERTSGTARTSADWSDRGSGGGAPGWPATALSAFGLTMGQYGTAAVRWRLRATSRDMRGQEWAPGDARTSADWSDRGSGGGASGRHSTYLQAFGRVMGQYGNMLFALPCARWSVLNHGRTRKVNRKCAYDNGHCYMTRIVHQPRDYEAGKRDGPGVDTHCPLASRKFNIVHEFAPARCILAGTVRLNGLDVNGTAASESPPILQRGPPLGAGSV
jgi:hypothetical protein